MYHEYHSVIVRGYNTGLTSKTILNNIVEYIREEVDFKRNKAKNIARKWTNTTEVIDYIKRKLLQVQEQDSVDPLVILIQSMDMGVLKGQEWQEMLGELATVKMLRFIITVDNSKSGVLFTDHLLDQYNFVCLSLDTFEAFQEEFEYQPTIYSAKNDNQELGLAFILKSMTGNQRNIIK